MARLDKKATYDYNNKLNREHYDRVSLMLPKGKKDIIKAAAAEKGESTNAFINRAIDLLLESEQRK